MSEDIKLQEGTDNDTSIKEEITGQKERNRCWAVAGFTLAVFTNLLQVMDPQ